MVGAEAGAHQLLEQPGLLVGALGAAEAGECFGTIAGLEGGESLGGKIQRLLPARLAEVGQRVGRIEVGIAPLGHALAADQRPGQPRRMVGVVEAEAPLDAEPALVGGAVSTGDKEYTPSFCTGRS